MIKIKLLPTEKLFIAATLAYALLCTAFYVATKNGTEVLFLSANYSDTFNYFFSIVTRVAEVNGIFVAAILIFWLNRKMLFPSAVALVLETLFVHALKWLVDEERPRLWAQNHHVFFPQIASDLLHYSFPSGHTAVIFCIAYCLARLNDNWKWTIFFFVIAVLVGLSRIYLMAHFVIDTGVGALIGTFSAFMVFQIYDVLRLKSSAENCK